MALGSVLYAHDAATGRVLAQLPIRQGTDVPAAAAALGSVSQDEAPGSWAAQVVTLDLKTLQAKKLTTAGLVPGFSTRPVMSGGGSRVVTSGNPGGDAVGRAQVWDAVGGKPPSKVEPRHAIGDETVAPRGVAVSADGKVAAAVVTPAPPVTRRSRRARRRRGPRPRGSRPRR